MKLTLVGDQEGRVWAQNAVKNRVEDRGWAHEGILAVSEILVVSFPSELEITEAAYSRLLPALGLGLGGRDILGAIRTNS